MNKTQNVIYNEDPNTNGGFMIHYIIFSFNKGDEYTMSAG